MLALDHYHYARWLSIHIKDLQQLETSCPSVYRQFMVGHFVTQKSTRKFSTTAHDQIHEQLNAVVKGDGGILGITEDEQALRRWMIGCPEISRMLNDYDETHQRNNETTDHKQIASVQANSRNDVKNMVKVLRVTLTKTAEVWRATSPPHPRLSNPPTF